MSRTVVVVCHRAAPSECSWPSRRATRTDPGSDSGWRSAGAASKQTMELSACATYPAQAVFSLSTFRGAHWLSALRYRADLGSRRGAATAARRVTSPPKPCRFAQLRTNIGGCQGMQVLANCGALLQ